MRSWKRMLHGVVVCALALGLGSGRARAAIPGPDGTFTACYLKATGTVRVIDASDPRQRCLPHLEVQVTWGQRGVAGAPGRDGASVTASPIDPVSDTRCGLLGGVEIQQDGVPVAVICAVEGPPGAKGETGSPGLPGARGAPGAGAVVAVEPPGAHCVSGGARITDGAGTSVYVCNGTAPAFPVAAGFLVARSAALWGYATQTSIATAGTLAFALKPDGTLWAWGSGAIGDGTSQRSSPVQIGSGFTSVSTGGSHAVAVKADGTLWAWGTNGYGQLGDGTTTPQSWPVQIGTGYASACAGGSHSIAIKTTGDLWAWGFNGYGQVGDGTTAVQRESPVRIGSGFSSAAAGSQHTLAVKSDGTLWAWGYDYFGQLGDGAGGGSDHESAPENVGSGYVSIVAFSGGSAAFQGDGTLWVWGKHLFRYVGARGDEPIYEDYSPVLVGTFAAVAQGVEHTVVLKQDGTLWAWGDNTYGQLGDGGPSGFRATPALIGAGFTAVAAGSYHTLAVKADGTLWGWGRNDAGQVGDGTTTQRRTPVQIVLQ